MNHDNRTDGRCVTRIGPVVVLHGPALRVALDCVLIACRARKLSGLQTSAAHHQLAQELADAMAAGGQVDVLKTPAVTPSVRPTITVDEAAATLGLSKRQTRRLAPKLGGQIVSGRWLIDELAIDEHLKGGRKWTG